MSNLILMAVITVVAVLFISGCKGEIDEGAYYTKNVTTGSVREYNTTNEVNRVNILITMGQSNSKGTTLAPVETGYANVYVPNEITLDYPETLTFKPYTNVGLNKADVNTRFVNSASEFAKVYNDVAPLYIVNIARGATGIDFNLGSQYNHWSVNRLDLDRMSLHPQAIHYIETLITQLQNDGKEPYVIGVDWNQWETANTKLTAFEYFTNYSELFDTFSTVIPNADYKLFLCNPTSNYGGHGDRVSGAFELIQQDRPNVFVYKPDELGVENVFKPDNLHYTNEVYEKIAEYIKGKL